MAGINGVGGQGIGLNQGVGLGQGGVQGLDQGGGLGLRGGPQDQIKQLFEQLVKKLLESQQGQQGAQGAQQPQGAQGAQQGAQDQGSSLRDLIEELKRKAKENPAAFAQAMQQNPAFAAVAQVALGGGGGGGSVGGIR